MRESFGQHVRALRTRRELSLRGLAELAGITPGYLSKIENGRLPSVDMARILDDALDADGTLLAVLTVDQLPRPAQLPLAMSGFVGREAEVRDLTAALERPADSRVPLIIAVDGPPGAGKTTLALHFAHRAIPRFPDGQLYADLRGHSPHDRPALPAEVLADLLRALGVPAAGTADVEHLAALYRSALAERRMLIVLDNAADFAQIEPLLPGTARCAVIITSRERLSGLTLRASPHRLTLGPMSEDESLALLATVLGRERAAREPAALASLAARCGRLPLALRVAAERAVMIPDYDLHDLVTELDSERLDVLGVEDADVRTVFSWSLRRLDPDAARLFPLLGLHPGPQISGRAAAAFAGMPHAFARRATARLTHAHLLRAVGRDRYTFHDLIRDYAAELADRQVTDISAAVHRLASWYLHSAAAACHVLAPFRFDPMDKDGLPAGVHPLAWTEDEAGALDALRWCDAELANIVPIIQLAMDHGHDKLAWQLPVTLWTYLLQRRPWTVWLRSHELAREATRRLGDRAAEGWVVTNLAEGYRRMGDLEPASRLYDEARALRAEVGDRYGLAWALAGSGFLAADLGDHARAQDFADQATQIFLTYKDIQGQALCLMTRGDVLRLRGDLDGGLALCGLALGMMVDIASLEGQVYVLRKMVEIHLLRNNFPHALALLDDAVTTGRELRDRWAQAESLTRRGDVLMELGRRDDARASWQQAVTLYDEIDDTTGSRSVRELLAGVLTASSGPPDNT
ncbi:ATP-binding protein [Kutzneria sp. CA-103260]|uniref:ATP-binding protein n=1 Tax=Kutzneria sp. CA-103260 TaxID=2802641 RepID=UPI001BACFCFB|nr:tetratricopeptide repeat protein [Kutzneria sp. CA-103260]QUQ68379.1 Tetratricopeptide repeat protein [Kutzneria sp. CA-103260]